MRDFLFAPLERAFQRELEHGPLTWDEWEEVMDEIEDDTESTQVEKVQIPISQLRTQMEPICAAYRIEYAEKIGCTGYAAVKKAAALLSHDPSSENLLLFCRFLKQVDRFPQEDFLTEDEYWKYHFLQFYESGQDHQYLLKRRALRQKFQSLLPMLKHPLSLSKPGTECDITGIVNVIADVYGAAAMTEPMLHNLQFLVQAVQQSKALYCVYPLFLYQIFVRHRSRLGKSEDIRFRMDALWKYQKYMIQEDNGKNFAQYMKYIALFESLCKLFQDDPLVDIPLCQEGFFLLSNLSEFYYDNYEQEYSICPEPIGLWVEDHFFSCFPLGMDNCVTYGRYHPKMSVLDRFQCARHRRHILERLSRQMNRKAEQLFREFCDGTDPEDIGNNLLAECSIRPTDEEERQLYVCSIEEELMGLCDYYAEQLITKTLEKWIDYEEN